MKTKILHLVMASCFLGLLPFKTVALNYTITFTGTGASTTVNSVIVQNLTKGTSVTVPAGDVLNLSDAPNAVEQISANDETILVYPSSVDGKSRVSFSSKQAGNTQVNAFSIDGRKVVGISTDLQAGSNTFELSLPRGVFVIQVTGNDYAYTAKMLNPSGTQGKPEIVYTGTEKPASSSPQKTKSSILGTTTMAYTTGDQLLYKAVSGNYSTIVTDVPTDSKTTNFNFVACTDADGNNYTVVTIGTQTWMAENLKTTLYNDGTAIPNVTDNTAWAALSTPGYCWYNDSTTYKNTYGALYNWYTVYTGKLAPTGWRVPSNVEWLDLGGYLAANGYNYDGSTSGNYYGKSLAATTNWAAFTSWTGAIGNDLSKNNRTGFSALPAGWRNSNGFAAAGYDCGWWRSSVSDPNFAFANGLDWGDGKLSPNYGMFTGLSVRCVMDLPSLPILTTTVASSIITNTATTGGNITNDGGAPITARGVCWSTSSNPTITDSITTDGIGTGIFTSTLNGLTANTTYNIRAYATNSVGTAYGTQISFTTPAVTITDIDGNVYHIVTIGTQTWMVENLKTTRYNDGTAIPLVTDSTSWGNLTTPGYCWYNNDAATYKNMYGALYNWYAVNSGKLAPTGWHVSTDGEWTVLGNYLTANGYNYNGSTSGDYYAKSLATTTNWYAYSYLQGSIGTDLSKNNSTGFSAMPGGCRDANRGFTDAGSGGGWWSSSMKYFTDDAWIRYMNYSDNGLQRNSNIMSVGYSVRCVRDN